MTKYNIQKIIVLNLGLEGITEVDTDPERSFVSFKVTTSNESSVYAPSRYRPKEQLARERFFQGLQNYMQNKNEGNETKIMLWRLKLYYGKYRQG